VAYLRTIAAFVTLALGARCASAADQIAWHSEVAAAVADAEQRDLPILVYLTSSHCPYCVKMKNQTLGAAPVVAAVGEKFVALTVARGTAPELERRLAVSAYPTTVVLRADQSEIGRVTGFVSPTQLTTSLERFNAMHFASKPAAMVK
jgi:uncharacterized protein YyaL (SSP411 family)